jgi:hypothetical protein
MQKAACGPPFFIEINGLVAKRQDVTAITVAVAG